MAFYTIHARDMSGIMFEKRAIVIDVREREAYRQCHYRGALNCPYEEIERWMFRFSKKRVLLLYCDYGSTSLLAARKLAKAGYEVYTVVGGIHAIKEYEARNGRDNN